MSDNFKLNGDGDAAEVEATEESPAELAAIHKKLSELKGEDGQVVSLTPQQLGILKQLLHPPDKYNNMTEILLICDFLSEEEADDELAAFYEAKRLGMDTQFNIDHALSRAAINRKGHRTSRAALIMDTMSHQKYTSNTPGGKREHSGNPRSPLS